MGALVEQTQGAAVVGEAHGLQHGGVARGGHGHGPGVLSVGEQAVEGGVDLLRVGPTGERAHGLTDEEAAQGRLAGEVTGPLLRVSGEHGGDGRDDRVGVGGGEVVGDLPRGAALGPAAGQQRSGLRVGEPGLGEADDRGEVGGRAACGRSC